jgi:hypothetical protein
VPLPMCPLTSPEIPAATTTHRYAHIRPTLSKSTIYTNRVQSHRGQSVHSYSTTNGERALTSQSAA